MLCSKPRRHPKMIDMRMCDDRIRHPWGLVWIAWWVGRGQPIVEQKLGSRWIFHHDANVTDLITSTKVMKPETMFWRKRRVGGRSTWIVHHHNHTKAPSDMNLWTYTPAFPLDDFFLFRHKNFCCSCEEDDRPTLSYPPMTSSIRHFSFDLFAIIRAHLVFQWKRRGLVQNSDFLWKSSNVPSNGI